VAAEFNTVKKSQYATAGLLSGVLLLLLLLGNEQLAKMKNTKTSVVTVV